MPFIKNILQHKSVSIVGMAKNTGKTTCLNYVLNRLEEENRKVAVTSIGVDGEERDVLYDTLKPRIRLKKGNYFITSEKHFAERELDAKTIAVSHRTTALGRLITAEAQSEGQVILSGPSDSLWLHECIDSLANLGAEITLVDGALSRMSLASPAITDAMVLCTGAACSIQMERLIKKVKYLCDMINLPPVNANLQQTCLDAKEGVWALTETGFLAEKITDSLFVGYKLIPSWTSYYKTFFINGVLTDNFLKVLNSETDLSDIRLIVRDFSRIFVHPATYSRFVRKRGTIAVLQQAKLLALCTNPTSPEGYHYDAEVLRGEIEKEVGLPVYDIVMVERGKKIEQ
jgi:molybdopterin-guanine dinucleotide biosynthesis protein